MIDPFFVVNAEVFSFPTRYLTSELSWKSKQTADSTGILITHLSFHLQFCATIYKRNWRLWSTENNESIMIWLWLHLSVVKKSNVALGLKVLSMDEHLLFFLIMIFWPISLLLWLANANQIDQTNFSYYNCNWSIKCCPWLWIIPKLFDPSKTEQILILSIAEKLLTLDFLS